MIRVRHILRITFRAVIALLFMTPPGLLLLVRFTDGVISDGEKIVLGYDENNKRFQFWEPKVYELNGVDGPYLIDGQCIRVDENNEIQITPCPSDSLPVFVRNTLAPAFYVRLRDTYPVPADTSDFPEKMLVISDIEGNFEGFTGFLKKNGVINDRYEWTFGQGHIVFLGDFVDRGGEVLPVLWLIYHLEGQALRNGGCVHYILGNHEIMNIQGNWRYAQDKYKKIAQEIGRLPNPTDNYRLIYSQRSELGRWLRSKSVVGRIGTGLFVHGGISPDMLPLRLPVSDINHIVRVHIDQNLYHEPGNDPNANVLMGRTGPFWYRGLVENYKYYDKITEPVLDEILRFYQTERMIIGHTIVDDISSDFNGKVIRIDVRHGTEQFTGKTKGLWIEQGKWYKINDLGHKTAILLYD